jgi:hypothetical protein
LVVSQHKHDVWLVAAARETDQHGCDRQNGTSAENSVGEHRTSASVDGSQRWAVESRISKSASVVAGASAPPRPCTVDAHATNRRHRTATHSDATARGGHIKEAGVTSVTAERRHIPKGWFDGWRWPWWWCWGSRWRWTWSWSRWCWRRRRKPCKLPRVYMRGADARVPMCTCARKGANVAPTQGPLHSTHV